MYEYYTWNSHINQSCVTSITLDLSKLRFFESIDTFSQLEFQIEFFSFFSNVWTFEQWKHMFCATYITNVHFLLHVFRWISISSLWKRELWFGETVNPPEVNIDLLLLPWKHVALYCSAFKEVFVSIEIVWNKIMLIFWRKGGFWRHLKEKLIELHLCIDLFRMIFIVVHLAFPS